MFSVIYIWCSTIHFVFYQMNSTNEKSHFLRLNEKCPEMHLNEMKIRKKIIIYRTNDVYIIQKVSTVLCPSLWWRQLNIKKYRSRNWWYGVCCRLRSLIIDHKSEIHIMRACTVCITKKNDQWFWFNSLFSSNINHILNIDDFDP